MGIDIDANAISYAKKNIENSIKNVKFVTLSEFNESKISNRADCVICFEVFEHVSDPHWLLSFLKQLATDNGKLLLSTPNGLSSNGNKALFRSQFHVKEYTPFEFYDILRDYGTVHLYGERRIDRLDVKTLLKRSHSSSEVASQSRQKKASVPLGSSVWFNLATRFLNRSFFWKIYSTEPRLEIQLSCSTLFAVLTPAST